MFKRFASALGATILLAGAAQAGDVSGTGATFPEPIYKDWAATYKAKTGSAVNYVGIGSGGGIKAIKAKTVDFGATDKPLTAADLSASGLYMFPMVIGGVAPIVNIPGVAPGQLKLTGGLLADIYMGSIKNWSDPRIAAFNKGVTLPNLPITVVHRSDGSGTSFLFTSYLSIVNGVWKAKVGGNDSPPWPVGVGGKGNPGVSALVKQTTGSVGYVEYFYAKQNHETTVQMENASHRFLLPTAPAFAAAAAGAKWTTTPGNAVLLLNQPGANAWPISGATFILVYKDQPNAAKGADILKFFDWAYKAGDAAAASKDYVPMPAGVKAMVRKQWADEVKSGGKPVYISK
jgi:phosphate transport system substrate-binding protein